MVMHGWSGATIMSYQQEGNVMRVLKRIVSRITAVAAIAAMFGAGAAFGQDEQTFEGVYGSPDCPDAGRCIIPVHEAGGGYISVGESFGSTADCSQSDVYIVRTNNIGDLVWSMTYDIGGNDSALSIRQVMYDPEGQGGFIITGVTANESDFCPASRDVFLMRIDRCGNLLWLRTYGYPETDEIGWEVVETMRGNDAYGTSPGDFVVAGSTTYPDASSTRNGYILRVRGADGGLIWDRVYFGPSDDDDAFYSVDEAIFDVEDGGDDIVAAGGTRSYTGEPQGWIVRVSGNDGKFYGGVHASAAYGRDGFEEFRSIRELRFREESAGHLAAVGTTTGLSGGNDVYVVETMSHPCKFVADVVFGTFGDAPDEGYAIREIEADGNFYRRGYLIVTGYMNSPEGRWLDVFLQALEPGTLNLSGPAGLYGGEGVDWGWSVESFDDNDEECRARGFIVTGLTQSPDLIGNDPQQMYIIKTNVDLDDNCTAIRIEVPYEHPRWDPECSELEIGEIGLQCESRSEPVCRYWWELICQSGSPCDVEPCELCGPEGGKRTVPTPEIADGAVTGLGSFPNPVKQGTALTLEYTLTRDASMTVVVSDVAGRTIHQGMVNGRTGTGTIEIGTDGWSAGTYTVSVMVDGRSTATRVVVTE